VQIAHVVHLVNRDYQAMCRDYYALNFMDPSVDTSPIAPALANFFDDVLENSVSQLNFKSIVDGLGEVLFQYPFQVSFPARPITGTLAVERHMELSGAMRLCCRCLHTMHSFSGA
jgi:predicted unusual protein kinase regulating ubiquinone biosynthesis (AarF/ABC1/UbiB family)